MGKKWNLGCKRIAAWLLAAVMVMTSLNFGTVNVQAAGVSASGGVELGTDRKEDWYNRINLPQYAIDLYTSVKNACNYNASVLAGRYLIYESALKSGDYQQKNNSLGTFYAKKITTINRATQMSTDDEEDIKVRQCVRTVFDVLQMDHPEVFWLREEPEVYRVKSGSDSAGWVYTYYLMMSCDREGYDIRDGAYVDTSDANSTLLTDKIKKLNNAVDSIITENSSMDDAHKVQAFAKKLIENGNYECAERENSSFYANQSLAAIVGTSDTDGDGVVPTDVGYAKAMKVLCDNADISCVITEGTVNGKPHMWNYVYMSDTDAWYAVDVATDAALSSEGSISEKWLLLGTGSIIENGTNGTNETYLDSHTGGLNQLHVNGELPDSIGFTNEPELSTTRYILNPVNINGVIIKAPTKGNGTENNPYQISTEEQLFWLAAMVNGKLEDGAVEDVCAILTENITLTHAWVPIGIYDVDDTLATHEYQGVFDGNYKTITGLNIDSSKNPGERWGFCGTVSGTVKNLHLSGASFTGMTGDASAGTIAHTLSGGTIECCYVDGELVESGVTGSTPIGGIVYGGTSGTISGSYTLGNNLQADNNNTNTVTNSYFLYEGAAASQPSEGKTVEEFAGGVVTWALNGGSSADPVWRQNIDMGTLDSYPVWYTSSGVVYYSASEDTYSNKRYLNIETLFKNTLYTYNNTAGDVVHLELPEDVTGNPRIYYSFQKKNGTEPDREEWSDYDSFDCTTFAPGTYFILATVEGATNYSDAQGYTTFTVSSKDFSKSQESTGLTVTLNSPANGTVVYNGQDVTPIITVKDGSKVLTEGEDYTFASLSPTPYDAAGVGKKVWKVTGMGGNYIGSREVTFEITKAETSVRIANSYAASYDYTGNSIASPMDEQIIRDNAADDPSANVDIAWYQGDFSTGELDNTKKLGSTVTPKDAGTYTLVVTVTSTTGNYETASVRKLVTINKIAPSEELFNITSFEGPYEYNGQEIADVTITAKGGDGVGDAIIKYRKSGATSYLTGNPKDAGTYDVVAVIEEGGNYLSAVITVGQLTIMPKTLTKEMFGLDVNQYYKGVEIRPEIDTSNEPYLTEDDYSPAYRDNTSIGTATVTFTGKNNYTGDVTMEFEIHPKTLPEEDFYRLECKGSVVDYSKNWYTEGVKIYPAEVEGKTMTIWRDNSTSGSSYIEISQEGITNCRFYLKDEEGYIYYMEYADGTYDLADLDFYIDTIVPSFTDGGLVIGNQTVTNGTYMLGDITFSDSEIYTTALNGTLTAFDQYSGVAKCYYYIYSYAGDEDSIEPLTPDELKNISFYDTENSGGFHLTSDGRYVIYAYAEDNAGNKGGYICTQGITIDTTPPVITGTIAPTKSNGTLLDTEATIQFKASEYGTFYYMIEESGGSAPTVEQLVADGTQGVMSGGSEDSYQNFIKLDDLTPSTDYVLYIAASDKAGNNTVAVTSVDFTTLKIIPRFNKEPEWTGVYGTMIKDMEVNTDELTSTNGAEGTWSLKDLSAAENTAILQVNDAAAPMITLIFTPNDTEKYETIEVSVQPTVTKRPVTVTIPDAAKVYGEELSEITIDGTKITGATPEESMIAACENQVTSSYSPVFVTRDGVTDTMDDLAIEVTIQANQNTDVGTYAIEGASTSRNYDVTFVNGTLEITKATPEITIGTTSYTKVYGDGRFALEGLGETNTDSDGNLSFEITSSIPCEPGVSNVDDVINVLSSGNVEILGAGEAEITVSLPETKNFFAVTAQSVIKLTIDQQVSEDIAMETYRYVYAAGSKDAEVCIDLNEKLPQDKGSAAYKVTDIADDSGLIKDGNVAVDADGNLTYEVNRGEESQIGEGADITVEFTMQNYETISAVLHIEWRDKIDVKQSSTNPVRIVGSNTLTYGDTLGTLVLNTDSVKFVEDEDPETGIEVAGNLAWVSPGEAFDAGTESAEWEYVLEDTETYREPVKGTLDIIVKKASANLETPTAVVSPDEGNVCVYNPTRTLDKDVRILGDAGTWTVAGQEVTVEGSWSWEDGTVVPTADKTAYAAVFTPDDTINYESVTKMVELTTTKATPYLAEKPAVAEITYGDTLADAVFTGGLVRHSEDTELSGYETPVGGTFSWETADEKPWVKDSESTSYTVIFTPEDDVNYESIKNTMTVRVNPAEWPENKPESTVNVPFATNNVSGVEWPQNWKLASYESNWNLNESDPLLVDVVYDGVDSSAGNYVNEKMSVTIIRAACEHDGATEIRNAKAPTCTEEGYTGDTYCAIEGCGKYLSKGESIPELGHDLDRTKPVRQQEPTCTEDGYVVYACKRCGTEVEEPLISLNHDWSDKYTVEEPTCTEAGRKYIVCSRCGEINEGTVEEIPALGHTGGEATCTRPAICDRCGKTYGTTDPNNHTETEIRNAVAASCSQEGYTGDVYCSTCGTLIKKGETIAAVPHTWLPGVVTQKPTCTEAGIETFSCSVCGQVSTRVVEATGHKWETTYTIDKQPTVMEEGSQSIHCSVCGISKPGSSVAVAKLNASAGNTIYNSKASYTVTKTGSNPTVEYAAPKTTAATVTIPETVKINGKTYKVTSIAAKAFENNKKITKVVIGNNVTAIGNFAFAGCTNLTTVKIGNKVTTIGKQAFSKCTKLKSLTMGTNVTTIKAKAFYKCTSLTKVTIPAKVNKIGKQAFYGCKKLKSITIKTKKLKSGNVGSKAFKGIYAKAAVKTPSGKKASYKKILTAKGAGKKVTYK